MSVRSFIRTRFAARLLAATLVAAGCFGFTTSAEAGNLLENRAVGGVLVDVDGVLNNVDPQAREELAAVRRQALKQVPADINAPAKMRMVSLRRLEEAIREHMKTFAPLPDDMKYLAGLQRVQYILVYPEQGDIVLAGPGEGWTVDEQGNVVGATTGMPVLHLDDLLVGLRSADDARQGGISCSIDPTQEGLAALQNFLRGQQRMNPGVASGMEKTLGPQNITVTGIPNTSRFAQVMVAADYRMKRLAMHFDKPPVKGLPSFLDLMPASSRRLELPRWWLAPNYQPLLRDADGLAWELRSGVKALTDEEVLTEAGERQKVAKTNSPAQRWAQAMTAKYDELAGKELVFAELRNCMDLAVVGALIVKEGLAEKAGFSMPFLLDDRELLIDSYNPPKTVDSKASFLKKGSNWLLSASGGVLIESWQVASQVQESDELAPIRAKANEGEKSKWWWN